MLTCPLKSTIIRSLMYFSDFYFLYDNTLTKRTLDTLSTDLECTDTLIIRVIGWCWCLDSRRHCLFITWRFHVDSQRMHRNTRLRTVWRICWSRRIVRHYGGRSRHWLDRLVHVYPFSMTAFDDYNYCRNNSRYYSNDHTSNASNRHSTFVVIMNIIIIIIIVIIGVIRSITASRGSCA